MFHKPLGKGGPENYCQELISSIILHFLILTLLSHIYFPLQEAGEKVAFVFFGNANADDLKIHHFDFELELLLSLES